MATEFASWTADRPVDHWPVGETTLESLEDDGELWTEHRIAGAGVLVMSAALFLAPPAVALLVLAGVLR